MNYALYFGQEKEMFYLLHGSGEQTLSNFSQIFFGIANLFLSAAIGLCALVTIIRLLRGNALIGNFFKVALLPPFEGNGVRESIMEKGEQLDLFETNAARSLLDQLLTDSRHYTQIKDYKELLDFVVRLRNFAPFNAM